MFFVIFCIFRKSQKSSWSIFKWPCFPSSYPPEMWDLYFFCLEKILRWRKNRHFASSEDFFPDNLSSQGDMRVESMVIWKYNRFPTNKKIKSWSIPLNRMNTEAFNTHPNYIFFALFSLHLSFVFHRRTSQWCLKRRDSFWLMFRSPTFLETHTQQIPDLCSFLCLCFAPTDWARKPSPLSLFFLS